MAEVGLKAEARQGTGKGVARKLRAQGKIPAILYGRGHDPTPVAVDERELLSTLHTDAGANVLIDLMIDGQTHLTLARSVERHPVRGSILHVDFLKIARDQTISVDVPVHFDGESPGVKEGGVLEHHLWQLHLECKPAAVPERINVDVSRLAIGESVRVADIPAPEGVTILSPPEEIIVTCVVPQVLKVEEETAVPTEGVVAAAEESAAEQRAAEQG